MDSDVFYQSLMDLYCKVEELKAELYAVTNDKNIPLEVDNKFKYICKHTKVSYTRHIVSVFDKAIKEAKEGKPIEIIETKIDGYESTPSN